jgi:hypothetical protein
MNWNDGVVMPEKKEKITAKSAPAEVGPLFDKSFLASASVIMVLLLIAMFISWLPQFFMHQQSSPTQSAQEAPYPTAQNQTAAVQSSCKELLSNGSERYDFKYSIKAVSDATGTMDSHVFSLDTTNSTWTRETVYDFDFSQAVASMNISNSSAATIPSSVKFITKLDRDFRCTDMSAVMTMNGQDITQPLSCGGSTNDNFFICKDNLTEVSRTKLTVGAGTYDVTNYLSQDANSTISMADIPLPIEVSIGDAQMQLISYRKVA